MANTPQSTNNSLTQFLEQLLRVQKNSMEILGKLTEITSSNSPSVQISLQDQTGATAQYEVQGNGFITSEIARIDANFNSLIGQNGNAVNVRMPDGSFKKIIESTLFKEPLPIGSLNVPSVFNKKNNWFFENFLNPLLYVSFDITKYVNHDTQEISYKRLIINTDTSTKKTFFDSNLKGLNNIDYNSLLTSLSSNNISYFVDEEVISLPVSIPRYSGSFDVIAYKDVSTNSISTSGTAIVSKTRKYQLNTLKYSDNLQNFKNTLTLKPGDALTVGNATQYTVLTVDASTNNITVQQTSGTESISVGVGILNIAVQSFALKEAQINVGFDERSVIFIKAIDKVTNLTTRDYSPGVAFYTNELVISTPTGNMTLDVFYNQEVMDFGTAILSLAKEGVVPSIYGETPNPPRMDSSDFQVLLINSQKTDTSTINSLKTKIAQKNSISSELTQLDISIDNTKQQLNTSKFNSDAEKRAVQNQLNSLIAQKTSQSNLYASLIQDLATVASSLPPELSNPKYSVRGFFPIPAPQPSTKTLNQEVIQFVVSYRYLSLDGTSPGTIQLDFIDNNGETVRGYFSNWQEYTTKIRTKIYDPNLGIYVWATENIQDADTVNINQIDIPITPGEQVEIRVKSVSEAGWPVNPAVSDWSTSIIIPFPEDLSNDQEVLASLQTAMGEEIRVNFNNDLTARGLDLHLENSFINKDQYIAHTTDTIASGYYNTDGSIMTLYQKLQDFETRIAAMQAILDQARGSLSVSIIDPSGTLYSIANNSVIDLFAGYYSDQVNVLPSAQQKGAIISTVYQLVLSNTAASVLQLVSMFPGGLDIGLTSSATSTNPDYARRAYDIVPIALSSMQSANTANSNSYQAPPFQSAQQLSQYIYCRATDIGLVKPLVGNQPGPNGVIQNNSLYPIIGGTSTPFIWNGTYTGVAPNGGGGLSDFCIHTLHPDINDGTGTSLIGFNQPLGASTSGPAVYPKFVHSSFFNLQASDINGTLQTQYFPTNLGATVESYPLKQQFYTNDRYLIGDDTCGSYLFLAPTSYADILVSGTDYRATRDIQFGDQNKLIISIIFQYRMTDFFGNGTSGLGRLGGFSSPVTNLFYTKKIGIDIFPIQDTTFSFDVQISAKYKVDSPSQTSISPAQNTRLVPTQAELNTAIF